MDADRNGGDEILERIFLDQALAHQTGNCVMQRDEGAGDAGSARTAIGLDYVAVNLDSAFTELLQINHGAQAAPDQALDFLCAPGLLALGRFAPHALAGGTRQHAVFGGDPAFAAALLVRRHFLFDTGGADDFGVAALDQHRAFGVFGVAAGDAYFTQLVGLSGTGAHEKYLLKNYLMSSTRQTVSSVS